MFAPQCPFQNSRLHQRPAERETRMNLQPRAFSLAACAVLLLMAILAGAALPGASPSPWTRFSHCRRRQLSPETRFAAERRTPTPAQNSRRPVDLCGGHADYSHISWTFSESFFPAYAGQWVFGEWFSIKWNDPISTLRLARVPMLLVMLLLGWVLYIYARRLGGDWAGLLRLAVHITTPTFLAFGPLVPPIFPPRSFLNHSVALRRNLARAQSQKRRPFRPGPRRRSALKIYRGHFTFSPSSVLL
jgi:hypothetical protein